MNKAFSQDYENKENQMGESKPCDPLNPSRRFGTEVLNKRSACKIPTLNPLYLEYYASDIYTYFHSIESQHIAKFGYLKTQSDINEKMRAILIDWLIEVHQKFKLIPETLFLTVNILDRYLEKVPINRTRLQLAGVSAMLIASKYEEIYAPELYDFVYITDKSYSREDIISMESSMLKLLNFNICTPSSFRFLERYCGLIGATDKQFALARYLVELTLIDYRMLRFSRSIIAAAGVYLMHKVDQIVPEWPDVLSDNSPHEESELKICAREMCLLFQKAEKCQLQAVRRKFMQPQFFQVSSLTLI